MFRNLLFIFISIFILSGCGGGTSSNSKLIKTGIFIDSEVEGLKYITSSGLEGFTNSKGEYKYKEDDTVEFFIGNTKLGSIESKELISVLELEKSSQITMLLQAIDSDANPDNGITISKNMFELFEDSTIEVDSINSDNPDFLNKFKDITNKDFMVNSYDASYHAESSLRLKNLERISENLYSFYTGNINIYEDINSLSKINEEELKNSVKKRLNLYNFLYITLNELHIMQINAKKQINTNFDSIEKRREIISKLSTVVSETLVLAETKPTNTTKYFSDRTIDYHKDLFKNFGVQVLNEKLSFIPDAIRLTIIKELELIYGCADYFGKPSSSDKMSCINNLGEDVLDTVNDVYSSWELYKSTKSLNTLTVLEQYLFDYFYAAGNLSILFKNYSLDYSEDSFDLLLDKIRNKVLGSQYYSFDKDLFYVKRDEFILAVQKQTDLLVEKYGLKLNYNVLENSNLFVDITRGKYDIKENKFSICYKIENNTYFDIEDLNLNISIQDKTNNLVTDKTFIINNIKNRVKENESCISLNTDSNISFEDNYFTVNLDFNYLLDGKEKNNNFNKIVYLSNNSLYSLLKQFNYPIINLNFRSISKDNDLFTINATDSYVDPIQGVLTFKWEQVNIDNNYILPIDKEKNSGILDIDLPKLPEGITKKEIWLKVTATASLSNQSTEKIFSVIIDSNAKAYIEVPQAYAGEDIMINIGDTVTFNGENKNQKYYENFNTESNIDWYWLDENNEFLSAEKRFQKTFKNAGIYTYTLIVADDNPLNWNFSTSDKINIRVIDNIADITAPNISTNSILSFDENSKIFFEPKATDDSKVTFKIEGEDKDFFVLNETTNIIVSKESTDYETKKEYKITLIATDEYNNSSSKDIVININDINENVVLTPKITSLSPTSANLNEVVTFTVLGENLPSTVAMSLSDAECESVNYISSSKATISCTPKASGVKAFIVATKSGGEAINSDIALEVDVSNIEVINSCNLIKNNHTLASMLFNLDIGIESYDNPGYVTAPYLMENYEKYIPGMEVHAGVDFRSKDSNGSIARDEVYSLTDGKVVRADNQTSFGAVSIRRTNSSGQTVLISYGHLDEPNVEVGDIIKAGTLLGYTGDTGAPDAPHLHLEYRVNYANTSMVYNTSCGDNDCSKEEIKALTDNPIEILDLYCDSEKLPNLSLETNTPKTVNEEVVFTANLSESLDTKYTVKISLGDGGGGYLSPVIMDTNSDSTSFTYKTSISKAGERKYKVAIFETDVQISSWVNDTYIINENSTDTITHNGLSYGTVISPTTGRVWLDRNIGASRVCTSATDELCFGDYFQWGRNADGHEKLNSNISTVQVTNISNVGDGNFIQLSFNDKVEYDWANNVDSTGELRETQWNKIDGTSICPVGFRVPNKDELNDETYTTIIQSKTNLELFSGFLKLPSAGHRSSLNSEYLNKNDAVYLWTSSADTNGQSYYKSYDKNGSMSTYSSSYRTSGYSVRCIEDDSDKIVSENISNTVYSSSLRTPNGGEEWNNGEIQTIQWSKLYINSNFVDLYVLNDSSDGLLDKSSETLGNVVNTKKWYKFASRIENNGSYELDPALLNGSGNDYMILIVASDDKTKWDISDGTFSLNKSADSSNDNSIGHNGFVYNAITSSKTGRVWLDRNIGATKVCNSDISDFESYEMYMIDQIDCFGDYYQAKENNGNLNITNWEKSDGTSICPVGFKVPNAQEFFEEITTSSNTVYAGDMSGSHSSFDTNSSFLNLPFSGYKNKDGNIVRSEESLDLFNSNQVSIGSFWTSGQSSNSLYSDKYYSIHFFSDLKVQPRLLMNLENSFNIRCIKNEENGFIIK